jgi:hypothetical protein
MMEAAVVLDKQYKPIHWHLPPGRSGGALPDSRDLWNIIWENRGELLGIAHTHPGNGLPWPSHEDVTTFDAIERALGRRLEWLILSKDRAARVVWIDEHKAGDKTIKGHYVVEVVEAPGDWATELRRLSNYT